ncbi:MAG: ribbon-helix-helix protein, CopG family [Clostridia bacterium]
MGDINHTGEKKIQFWVEENLLEQLEEAIKKQGYKNRAEWFREKARETIKESSSKD